MPDAFDPYFKWLGIPKADQPPHAYRLLGIELFESDADVISNAVDGRMAQIKSFQAGKFGAVSQKVLNEIAAAKVRLLNPEKKAEYDRRLRAHLRKKSAAMAQVAEPEVAEAELAPDDSAAGLPFLDYSSTPQRNTVLAAKKAKRPAWIVPAGVSAGAIALLAGIVSYFAFAGDGKVKSANSETASLASKEPNLLAKSSGQAASNSSRSTSSPGGILTTKEKAQGSLSDTALPPTPKPAATPKPKTNPKPKIELVDDSEKTASPENTSVDRSQGTADSDTAAAPPSVKKEPAKKPPIPDKEQYQAMRNKVLKIFQKEFAEAKTSESKLALAVKLIEQGDASKDDVVERYTLWKIGADGASVAGDFSKAMDIVDKIQAQFDVDGDAMKTDILTLATARTTMPPEAARNLCEAALKLADAAVTREDLDAAAQFAKLAMTAVRRTKDPQFSRDVLARSHDIEHLKTRYSVVAKALETLGSDADNADANLAVGQWHCYAKGDWEKGLPYLAKGSREDLAALARQELAKPADAKDQVALADAWWTLAEKDRTESKTIYQARAVHWYELALPKLSGLEQTRVGKQIALARSGPAPEVHGHGIVQRGNVALASNGTTVSGVESGAAQLLNGLPAQRDVAYSKFPCVFTITFDKVYMLRQIRFHISEGDGKKEADRISASYRVAVSRDGKNFELLQDHGKELATGWQEMPFAARPVKAVKLEGLNSSNCNLFMLTQFEAYCFPLSSAVPNKKLR